MAPAECLESSANAVTRSWPKEHTVICELLWYISAQLKFNLFLPVGQQQEADGDWESPLCFPGVSLLFFPAECYEFFTESTACHTYSEQPGKVTM